ncbi:hypothetical protein CDAR_207351 [Caerostris darwini]|uniref:Uncharacterized protein n=1 Tax=Caerostris darwini TaxID=1538125 RepID=A0AAV4VIV4_9ARAC|nr:hypothetical protein CDAR_207351 [Caerostris darwini]
MNGTIYNNSRATLLNDPLMAAPYKFLHHFATHHWGPVECNRLWPGGMGRGESKAISTRLTDYRPARRWRLKRIVDTSCDE